MILIKYPKSWIRAIFYRYAIKIWGHSPIRKFNLTIEFIYDEVDYTMALLIPKNQKAVIDDDGNMVKTPKKGILRISEKGLNLNPNKFIKVIIHEVVHIGLHKHDKKFKKMVKKYGGIVS